MRKTWQIETDEGSTYLHPSVGMKHIESALEGLVLQYGKENLTVYVMEKVCRIQPNEDSVVIECNPQHYTNTRHSSRQIRQVYSTLLMRWTYEDGTEEPWVCRVFGILAVVTPDGAAFRLIVAYMEPTTTRTFLPYPVYQHYTKPMIGVVLYTADINDILDVAFMVPLLNRDGFEFHHHETRSDFEDIQKIQKRLYHCILPDRFAYPAQVGVEYFTDLACDDTESHKPSGVPKTFVTVETMIAFETLHRLDQPRKVTGNESEDEPGHLLEDDDDLEFLGPAF